MSSRLFRTRYPRIVPTASPAVAIQIGSRTAVDRVLPQRVVTCQPPNAIQYELLDRIQTCTRLSRTPKFYRRPNPQELATLNSTSLPEWAGRQAACKTFIPASPWPSARPDGPSSA